MSSRKNRKTLGVMIPTMYGEYAGLLFPGIMRAAAEKDVNLLVFPGRTEDWPDGYLYQCSAIYHKIKPEIVDALVIIAGVYANYLSVQEYNDFYERFKHIPGVSIGLAVPYKSALLVDNKAGFRSLVAHVLEHHAVRYPTVITGPLSNSEAKIRLAVFLETCEAYGITAEQRGIQEGGFTRTSGKEAVRAIFSALGDKPRPDALICCNDDMAFGAIQELQSMGLRVPFDIIVTGFDDVDGAQYSFPALSTISQPLEEQGYQAALMAIQKAEGLHVPDEIQLTTKMVLRSSCGCYYAGDQLFTRSIQKLPDCAKNPHIHDSQLSDVFWDFLYDNLDADNRTTQNKDMIASLFKVIETGKNEEKTLSSFGAYLQILMEQGVSIKPWVSILSLIQLFMENCRSSIYKPTEATRFLGVCAQIVASLLRVEQGKIQFFLNHQIDNMRTYLGINGTDLSLNTIVSTIKDQLSGLELRDFHIVTYDSRTLRHKNAGWREPDTAHLLIGCLNSEELPTSLSKETILTTRLLPDNALSESKRFTYIVNSLFFMDEVIGYMLLEMTNISRELYDTLIGHVSTALKTASLFQEREESEQRLWDVLNDLERSNNQLQKISENDELTGLYNRRGFISLAGKSLSLARQMKKGGLVFFADLDGFKQINDVFGHKEGDLAIRTAAQILMATFRTMDIIARLGGDEFTVLTLNADDKLLPVIRSRLDEQILQANSRLNKPWKISISIGHASFSHTDDIPLEKLMVIADELLYCEKQRKKSIQNNA